MANYQEILSDALDMLSMSYMAQSVLKHPNIWRINFQLNGLVVSGERYKEVAKAIEAGGIDVEKVDKFDLPPGQKNAPGTVTAARYVPEKNQMQFPRKDYGQTAYEKTVILHEATHAMFDLYAKSNFDTVLAIDDEAAATLAQAFYIRFCDAEEAIGKFRFVINGPGDLALKLVDDTIRITKQYNYTGTYLFNLNEKVRQFRDAIAQEWNLIKDADSDRSGVKSVYDGVKCSRCWSGAAK